MQVYQVFGPAGVRHRLEEAVLGSPLVCRVAAIGRIVSVCTFTFQYLDTYFNANFKAWAAAAFSLENVLQLVTRQGMLENTA